MRACVMCARTPGDPLIHISLPMRAHCTEIDRYYMARACTRSAPPCSIHVQNYTRRRRRCVHSKTLTQIAHEWGALKLNIYLYLCELRQHLQTVVSMYGWTTPVHKVNCVSNTIAGVHYSSTSSSGFSQFS